MQFWHHCIIRRKEEKDWALRCFQDKGLHNSMEGENLTDPPSGWNGWCRLNIGSCLISCTWSFIHLAQFCLLEWVAVLQGALWKLEIWDTTHAILLDLWLPPPHWDCWRKKLKTNSVWRAGLAVSHFLSKCYLYIILCEISLPSS